MLRLTLLGLTLLAAFPLPAAVFTCAGVDYPTPQNFTGTPTCTTTFSASESGRLLPAPALALPEIVFHNGNASTSFAGTVLIDPSFVASNPTPAIGQAIDLGIYPNLAFLASFQGTSQNVSQTSTTSETTIGPFVFGINVNVNTHTDTQSLWSLTVPESAVPEPATSVLLGGGGLLLAIVRDIKSRHDRRRAAGRSHPTAR